MRFDSCLFCFLLIFSYSLSAEAYAFSWNTQAVLHYVSDYTYNAPGISEEFQDFQIGVGYVFRNFDLLVIFIAIAYTWLYVDTITIVLGILITALGAYIAITYIDPKLVQDPNFLRAGLFILGGLIILSTTQINNRLQPVVALPIGIFSTLLIITTAPLYIVVNQDFINGALIGILLVVFVAMGVWYALGESWFLKVLQRTFGSFLLVAGLVVFGVAVK